MYDNDVHIDTTFSIYSNRTGVDFYTRPSNFTFYNCPMAVRYILALCIMVYITLDAVHVLNVKYVDGVNWILLVQGVILHVLLVTG